MRGLLEALARDLKKRQEASPGALVDNELLDSERYATLLDEIRAALALQTAEPATFRRLASALSAPALGLLLFLGGAVSVSCDHGGLHGLIQARDAAPFDVDDTSIAQPTSQLDASIFVNLPDAPPAPNVVDAAQPEANPDLPRINLFPPDARPATDVAFAPSQSDGGTVTIQDMMDSCNVPDGEQEQILGCLANLRASWTTGLADFLAGSSCDYVANQLVCFVISQDCQGVPPAGEFNPNLCKPIIIYAGVRFV